MKVKQEKIYLEEFKRKKAKWDKFELEKVKDRTKGQMENNEWKTSKV